MSGFWARRKRDWLLEPFSDRRSRSRTPPPGLAAPPASSADCLSQTSAPGLAPPAHSTGQGVSSSSVDRLELPAVATALGDPIGYGASSASVDWPAPTASVSVPPSQTDQTAVTRHISLADILDELEPQQRGIISQYCGRAAPSVGDSMQEALSAAEKQKELCDEKRWSVVVGTKTIYLREKADTIIDLISKFKNFGTAVASLDQVHAGLPWAGVCVLLQIFVGQKEQKDALLNGLVTALSMQKTADLYADFYANQSPGRPADELWRVLVKAYATIFGFLAESLRLWQSGASRFWGALTGDGELQKFPARCQNDFEALERAAATCARHLDAQNAALVAETKKYVVDIVGQLEGLQVEATRTKLTLELAKLTVAKGAQFDSYDQQELSTCLSGTRVGVQEDIARWVNDPAGECFFWLQGIAGEGKSTLAKTVATTLRTQRKLGASFFFKRDNTDRGDARLLFSTIAIQLAQSIEGMKSAIARILGSEPDKYDKDPKTQFEDFIAGPLRKIGQASQSASSGLIIVIDALDECSDIDVKQVLELLLQANSFRPFGIKTLITSRPDVPVRPIFSSLDPTQYRKIVLQDHTQATINDDILLFLSTKFQDLRSRDSTLEAGWPGVHRIQS